MTYAAEVLADSPRSYYRLGETTTTLPDSLAVSPSLQTGGTVTKGVAGLIATDPTDAAFQVANGRASNTGFAADGTTFTVEVWLKTANAGASTRNIVQRPIATSSQVWALTAVDNQLRWQVRDSTTATHVVTGPLINDNVAHHLVGTFDGATARLYVDGVQVGGDVSVGTVLTAATQGLWVGQTSSLTQGLTGTLDELAYYPTPLSAARVLTHYQAGSGVGLPARGTAALSGQSDLTAAGAAIVAAALTLTGESELTAAGSGGSALPIPGAAQLAGMSELTATGTIRPLILVGTDPRDLAGNSRLRTGEGFVDITVPVAPEPPTIRAAPIQVAVDTLPAPSISAGHVAPMVPTTLRESEWGRIRIRVGQQDVTYFRDIPAQVTDYQLLDPYGYGPATLRFPQVTFWELPDFGTGPLSWLVKNAGVHVDHAQGDVQRREMWVGHIDAFDFDDDGALVVDCSGELVGRMDKTYRTQRLVRGVQDAGWLARIALSVANKHYRLKGSAEDWSRTGVPMENTGGGMGTNLAFLDYVLANAVDEDLEPWTILPTDADPRLFDLTKRDTTTVHATVYLGARGVKAQLRDDILEQPNRMFGEGVDPQGRRWRGAEYPNLRRETVPPYPFNDGRTFGAIGLSDTDTDTGAGVSVLEDELLGSGLLDLDERNQVWSGRTTEAVEEVQRRAGLAVTGRVNPDTWRAVWGDDIAQQRLSQARIRPLTWDDATEKWLLSPNGSRLGRNPHHDRSIPLIERMVSFGEGVSKRRARRWLRREMRRANGPNWRGTITLTSDMLEGEHTFGDPGTALSRLDIKAGQNIRVKRFGTNTGMLMHIASVQVSGLDGDSPSVTLAVDTQARDAITLAEMLERDKAARLDPARRWLNQHRRSAMPSDALVGWDYEAGAGVVRATDLTGGAWNVRPIVGGQAGEIQRVDLTTNPPTEFIMAVFARPVRPGDLQQRVGDPFADVGEGDVWQQVPIADWLAGLDKDERKAFEDEQRKRDGFIKDEDGKWVPPESQGGNITRGDNGKWQAVTDPPSGQDVADLIASEVNRREEITQDRIDAFSDQRAGVYVAGTTTQPCGYWPHSKSTGQGNPSGQPVTGRWRDDASFSYWTVGPRAPWLYLAVYPLGDCTVHGRMYDQLIEGS